MGDVEQAVAGNVVYENHTQNFIQPAVSRAQVLLDEHQFEKLTSMETSAQARVALLMLLEQHNISSKQLAQVWDDELTFADDQLHLACTKWVPRHISGLGMTWGLLTMVCVAFMAFLPSVRILAGVVAVGATIAMVWQIHNLVVPYMLGRKLRPMLTQVNEELPAVLAEWRREQRRGPDSKFN
ncbi:hypothetical protein FNU76_15740 [Chitinimonas arctica]|uniref:Uncharacterized protein n=1 Tax=Chitinimonas arctica TaxID=2594795 RepID=A0A516SHQ6_9NEIS|nr:hypothetical protein [Chitinimonas arctica]QDQ27684.1 hypothetical protein FNU76_15740 [Chitinimonas arctica]